jgi:hypothetical protein
MKSLTSPSIPYLGMYLRDLTFVQDGNNWVADPWFNMTAIRIQYTVIQEYLGKFSIPYNFEKVPQIIALLTKIETDSDRNTESQRYTISDRLEPRTH